MPRKKLFLSSITIFVLLSFPIINSVGASVEMWSQTYGAAFGDYARSLVETSDGGFAIGGHTNSFGAGDFDLWLVKTDEHGIIPEFPSWIIMPLFTVATLAVIIYRKRLTKK